MTYFVAFPHSILYLLARIAEYVFRFPATAVFLNPKVFIKNFAMGWRSHAHIWSAACFTVLLRGIINGGGLRCTNIQCSGINPFSLHWVKPSKKVVTVGRIPEQRLLFTPFFFCRNWTCSLRSNKSRLRPSGRGTSDSGGETRTKLWCLHLVSFRGNTAGSGCWQLALLSSSTYPSLDGSW